jgi:adenylate cyclase
LKKIELKYLRSDLIIQFVTSIIAGLSAVIWAFFFTSEMSLFDNKMIMKKFITEKTVKVKKDDNIIIIEIPENVMIRYNHPDITPRSYMSSLVRKLSDFKPKVIALDYIFDQPSVISEDVGLKSAFKDAGNVISGYKMVETIRDYSPAITDTLLDFSSYSYNLGYSNIFDDTNGVVRRINLTNNNYTSFAFEVVLKYSGIASHKINDEGQVVIDRAMIDELKSRYSMPEAIFSGPMLINYNSDIKNAFKIYDSDLVINCPSDNDFMLSELKDKIVIVGDSSYGRDVHRIPFSNVGNDPDTYGVLIQANIVKNILDRNFIKESPFLLNLVLVVFFLLITVYVSYNFKFIHSLIFFMSEFVSFVLLSYVLFIFFSIDLPVIVSISAMFLSWLAIILFRVAVSEKDNLDAEYALVKNIPDRIIKKYGNLQLDSIFTPKEAEAVILIACPKNIPELSEKNKPEKFIEFLNYYYRLIKEEVFAVDGSFNRILLNGVMAFWNTPLKDEDAVGKSLKAAKEILIRIGLINARGRELINGFNDICIDIAIHKGRVMAGYFGPDDNKDYTITGDNVNYTFDIANSYSDDDESWILITEELKASVKDKIEVQNKVEVLKEIDDFKNKVYRVKI